MTFQRNVLVSPASRRPSDQVLVEAESPPLGPSSTTQTGRSGSERRSSSTRWPNATVPEPAFAGSVSTVTATFGAAFESALRTCTSIVALSAIDCEAGNFRVRDLEPVGAARLVLVLARRAAASGDGHRRREHSSDGRP